MDIANQSNGIVIGTGDLSELALGWATYNGDHMSMYAVNASIPKTLIKYIINYEACSSDKSLKNVLLDILDTPVSLNCFRQKTEIYLRKLRILSDPMSFTISFYITW